MGQIQKVFGVEDPATFFDLKNDEGNEELVRTRDRIVRDYGDGEVREPRTWGAKEAADLVGRSRQWLRDNAPDAPRTAAGHARYSLEMINNLRDLAGTRYRRPPGSKPFTIAFSKLKGGVGNTTACTHFAHYLALLGYRVLFVDMDPQSSGTSVIGGLMPDVHLEEEDVPADALLNDLGEYPSTIVSTYFENVFLVPCNGSFQELDFELTRQASKPDAVYPTDLDGNPVDPSDRLSVALDMVKDQFDVILIDCAPALGMLSANALTAADCLVTPLQTSALDRSSYAMFSASLASFYDYTPKLLRYYRILITQYKESKGAQEEEMSLRNIYGSYVATHKIDDNAEIKRAPAELATVYEVPQVNALSNRETYKRASRTLKGVFDEIHDDLKAIWEMEAEDNG